jgi:hypothetical protein
MKTHRTGRQLTTEWVSLKKKILFVLDIQLSRKRSLRGLQADTPQDLLHTVLVTTVS